MWHVYILECEGKRLYTGITTDLTRRVKEHVSGKGANFTRAFKAGKLLYSETQPNRCAALKREALIKTWSKDKKIKLVEINNVGEK